MTRIEVKPEILRWALERVPTSEEDIRRKFPKLSEWLRGTLQPTLNQLESFSQATSTPFGYFFLDSPPEENLSIPLFRTISEEAPRRPSPNLLDIVQMMQRRQAWMREYLTERGYDALPFVSSFQVTAEPERVAQDMRRTLELGKRWAETQPSWTRALQELQKRAEDAGILVAASSIVGNNTHRTLDPAEFRGFILVDEYAPLVFINTSDSKAAQMFTLAHELAHIWLGSSAAFDLRDLQPARDKTEQTCNRIAAEFLVPADQLNQAWGSAKREAEPFQDLARTFKVSEIVVARRALDLGFITRDEFFEFYNSYRQRQTSAQREGGGNFYATQAVRLGKRFARTVIQAVQEGSLLYHEAYRLTDLHGRTFEELASRLLKESL